MIHTVQMFCKIKTDYYYALLRTLYKLSKLNKTRCYEKDNMTYCELLKKSGLKLTLIRIEFENGISYNALEIIMNPARLLNANEYFQLTDFHHYDAIIKAFEKAFKPVKKEFEHEKKNKHIKFKLHRIHSFSFKRVDFAVNIFTEHIEYYMKLIRRANIPDGFELDVVYDPISKRKISREGSFYLEHKNKNDKITMTINCYNKGVQLKSQNLPCNDEKATYTIRFEVQCGYNKVYRILKDNHRSIFGNSIFLNLLEEGLSDSILRYNFKKTIGLGDYYTLLEAKKKISVKHLSQVKETALLDTLDLVNERRGIWRARKSISNKVKFDKYIKELHELGVNPVTIPIKWGIDSLPCLFDLIS